MLKVIGDQHCSRCISIRNMLTNRGIEFEYHHLHDLPIEEAEEVLTKAREKKSMQLPILLKDGEIITIEEVGKNENPL